jgi:CubicO group peptidase (beta-lactamase class C family)
MKLHIARFIVIAGCLAAFALPLRAGAGAVGSAGKPEDVGLSGERLSRIRDAVQRHIGANALPGAVTLVARRGKIAHFEAHGLIDVEAKRPMPRDAVFRLASMSKPITAVAVMMLLEEGKVRLSDPVSRFIPEFAGAKVALPRPGRAGGGPGGPGAAGAQAGGRGAPAPTDLVTANRDITVRDLLTHTSGLMSGGPGNAQAPQRTPTDTLATYTAKLGAVPLDFQPGTMWRYSGLAGFDVLSRIVEVASGQPYDRFLRQRLFDPLGMKDTGFSFPSDASRMVPLYRRVQNGFERQPNQEGLSSPVYFSGAGGMVSTAEDYLQLAQMLVNGGELNGRRYLGPRTIELMASNHTGDFVNGQFGRPARGMGFGLGVQVVEDPVAADLRQSKGTFGWAGAYGTNQNMDPKEKMVTIVMMQVSTPALQRDFDNAVMQAIVD